MRGDCAKAQVAASFNFPYFDCTVFVLETDVTIVSTVKKFVTGSCGDMVRTTCDVLEGDDYSGKILDDCETYGLHNVTTKCGSSGSPLMFVNSSLAAGVHLGNFKTEAGVVNRYLTAKCVNIIRDGLIKLFGAKVEDEDYQMYFTKFIGSKEVEMVFGEWKAYNAAMSDALEKVTVAAQKGYGYVMDIAKAGSSFGKKRFDDLMTKIDDIVAEYQKELGPSPSEEDVERKALSWYEKQLTEEMESMITLKSYLLAVEEGSIQRLTEFAKWVQPHFRRFRENQAEWIRENMRALIRAGIAQEHNPKQFDKPTYAAERVKSKKQKTGKQLRGSKQVAAAQARDETAVKVVGKKTMNKILEKVVGKVGNEDTGGSEVLINKNTFLEKKIEVPDRKEMIEDKMEEIVEKVSVNNKAFITAVPPVVVKSFGKNRDVDELSEFKLFGKAKFPPMGAKATYKSFQTHMKKYQRHMEMSIGTEMGKLSEFQERIVEKLASFTLECPGDKFDSFINQIRGEAHLKDEFKKFLLTPEFSRIAGKSVGPVPLKYKNFKTKGEMVGRYVEMVGKTEEVKIDDAQFEEFYSDALVLLKEMNQIEPRSQINVGLFIKDESHNEDKIAEGRYRLIANMDGIFTIVCAFFCQEVVAHDIRNWRTKPWKNGADLDHIEFARNMKALMISKITSIDYSGFDWMVNANNVAACSRYMGMLYGEGSVQQRLVEMMFGVNSRVIILAGNDQTGAEKAFEQRIIGMMKSGFYLTLHLNSFIAAYEAAQVTDLLRCSNERWITLIACQGDDVVMSDSILPEDVVSRYDALNKIVKLDKGARNSFCSRVYKTLKTGEGVMQCFNVNKTMNNLSRICWEARKATDPSSPLVTRKRAAIESAIYNFAFDSDAMEELDREFGSRAAPMYQLMGEHSRNEMWETAVLTRLREKPRKVSTQVEDEGFCF